ncbi:hypothetical protein ACQR1W_09300 [Bradyrhizobium sp. HKCCYLS1011]|uniref:hypothetical protein n=1 Tax=Bradyrhizobium sp. HKCCYLS1011 TaxID=3420733 RepID=UPI003EC08811
MTVEVRAGRIAGSLFAIRFLGSAIGPRRSHTAGLPVSAAAASVLLAVSGHALAQTTRTPASSTSTISTLPASTSTSPNAPCDAFNPTSSCYSTRASRLPCYSATGADQRCADVSTPSTPAQSSRQTSVAGHTSDRAFTEDQAIAKIQARGFSNVSQLKKDYQGRWRGKADKDGTTLSVTLAPNGDITTD